MQEKNEKVKKFINEQQGGKGSNVLKPSKASNSKLMTMHRGKSLKILFFTIADTQNNSLRHGWAKPDNQHAWAV